MLHDWSRRQLRYEEAGLSDLRRDALVLVEIVLLMTALVSLMAAAVALDRLGNTPLYVSVELIVLTGVVHRLARLNLNVAATVLVGGLSLVIVASVLTSSNWFLLGAFALPVLIAVALLGMSGGLLAIVFTGGLAVAVAIRLPGVVPVEALSLTLCLAVLVSSLSAILWSPVYTVLDWSWTSFESINKLNGELQVRQVELGRLNQSLVHAYEQLKQTSAQLERARQAAEEARRLKSEFAASVSHELRTPLNLIIGLSELMVVTPHPEAPVIPDLFRADVEAIYRNACHISNLIDDVLDMSQIEAHHMGLLREWVALGDVVAQAAATVRTLFENTGLALDACLPRDLPRIFIDPIRVRQILINLLNNAVRFTEEGGVTVSARVDSDQMIVDVSDTGIGIPPQDLPGVFHDFWQVGEPRRGRRGSGLGLAVSKRFAELHGGNMWVSSTLGHGSTFTLSLPMGNKTVIQEASLDSGVWLRLEQQSPTCPSVLLLAPEPEAVRVFRRYLDGYQVIIVPDIPSAIHQSIETAARAIIVDSPARRDNLQRAFQRNEQTQLGLRLPVVTCTLRTSRTHAEDLGVQEYMIKPVNQHQLQRVLRRLGRGHRELLLVDDDPEMLHLLSRMVSALAPRTRIHTAVNGWQAIEILQQGSIQGVFLDMLMPGLDGYGVLAEMKRDPRLAAIPVVVISARGEEDEGLVAESFEITQAGGLRVTELCRWLRSGLDSLQPKGRPVVASIPPAGLPV